MKRRNAPTTARGRSKETNVARLTRELHESVEQQTATSEILAVISSSLTNTQPVFDAIVQSGLKLFPDAVITVVLADAGMITAAAIAAPNPVRVEAWRRTFPYPLTRQYMHGIAILDREVVDFADVADTPAELIVGARNFLTSGHRAITIMPMIRGVEAIGAISVVRLAPGPLSNKQLAVLRTFANQAVIAIENARLLSELRESLQQQTATADVLKVISASPGDLEPVFGALLENATRICEAQFGNLSLYNGETFQNVALHNPPAGYAVRGLREVIRPHAESGLAYVARTKQIAHIGDIRTQPPYLEGDPAAVGLADVAGARTLLIVPMIKEDTLVGTIAIYRQEIRLFTDKQIELVRNFAAQAVIAIENTRLLSELRESLQRQTAAADVLKVISSSPGNLTPVFDAILQNAVRICDAKFGHLWLREGDSLRIGGTHGAPDAFAAYLRDVPVFRPKPETGLGQLLRIKQLFHLADITALPTYGDKLREATIKLAGARSLIGVPMIKDDEVIGTIVIYRQEVRPFTDKQIELVQNFAAQAVIAIENTRLLNELRESLQQQTATAEVLKVIAGRLASWSPCSRPCWKMRRDICEAKFGNMWLCEGDGFRTVALHAAPPAFAETAGATIVPSGPDSSSGSQLPNQAVGPNRRHPRGQAYLEGDPAVVQARRTGGRANTARRADAQGRRAGRRHRHLSPRGAAVHRQADRVGQNFAAQAVIAIENTRLLNELRKSLQQQTATADVLKVISRSTFDLQTGA